jgi:glutamate decarboxylase
VGQTGGASEASGSDFERRILSLFRIGGVNAAEDDHRAAEVDSYLETLGDDFVNSPCVNSPDVTCAEIAERFTKSELPDQPQETSAYFAELGRTVVEDATHTSSPLLVGHMTSALPYYTRPLAKLVVSMNQNVVKTVRSKQSSQSKAAKAK